MEPAKVDFECNGDSSSDYGSEFSPEEESALIGLLSKVTSDSNSTLTIGVTHIGCDKAPSKARVPRIIELERRDHAQYFNVSDTEVGERKKFPTVEIDGNRSNQPIGKRLVKSGENRTSRLISDPVKSESTPEPEDSDLRSPLERFRTKPKKALSVTDLVSPSWCELQYWYVLTKHGKKRRTPAMRQGSAVHKTLEDQVHRTVAIDIQSKEDAWALRIWNVIQGLKTLRETGMTRELEVWGVIDGLVVNGVIDELSYICPDKDLEEEVTARTAHGKGGKDVPSTDQSTITSFMGTTGGRQGGAGVLKSLRSMRRKTSKIYLTDVKTRGAKTVPKGASFRPTLMQLMLYHLLLSDLATNQVDANVLFNRYELNPSASFSDGFIAQIGSLHETYYDAPSDPSQSSNIAELTQDSTTMLLEHNSLKQLWGLMISELHRTMPAGANSIGSVLKAEYRDQADGAITGIKTFLYDRNVIQDYVDDELRWWKGEREAQGVSIEEAYKCRSCEFAEGCEWRIAKIDEATTAYRTRSRSVV
ncbi:hypothetical protein MMC13_008443 [Lambiella insularis]|nr:hypothetical protein [Lambiella insularis]